jgi:integrase/recombinase XerD
MRILKMKTYLEPTDIRKIEEASTNLRDRLLIHVLFHLGCRVSEALSLEVKNIDFTKATITIKHLKCRIELSCPMCHARLGKCHAYCPKCGRQVQDAQTKAMEHQRYRPLPVDIDTLKMLENYIKKGGPVEKDGKSLLFGIKRGRAFQVVKECSISAGYLQLINPETGKMHNVSPHRLRDAFAVNAVKHDDSGGGLRMLQEHLGHQNFNTTARYRKVAGEELKRWYDGLWEEHGK